MADGSRPVAVVLGVAGAVDSIVDAGVGLAKGDVTLDPTGADAAGAAGGGRVDTTVGLALGAERT